MKLLTKEILSQFRKIGSQEENKDPILVCKFFTPDGGWTWYPTEYNEKEGVFFGYVIGLEKEWGYFSLSELSAIRGKFGLQIERDRWYKSCTFSEL